MGIGEIMGQRISPEMWKILAQQDPAQMQAPAPAPQPMPSLMDEVASQRAAIPAIPSIDPKSGRSEKDSYNWKQQDRMTTQQQQMLDPNQFSDAVSNLMNTKPYRDLAGGISAQEAALAKLSSTPQGVDYSPLASLVDSWAGTNLAAHAKPTMAGQEQAQKMFSAQDKLQGDRRDLLKSAIESVKAQKAGQNTSLTDTLATIGLTMGAGANGGMGGRERPPSLDIQSYRRGFLSNPIVKDAQNDRITSQAMLESMKNSSWITDTMLQANLTEIAKLKPVSDSDRALFQVPPDLQGKVDTAIGKWGQGKVMQPADKQAIRQFADLVHKRSNARINAASQDYALNVGAGYGWAPTEAAKYTQDLVNPGGTMSNMAPPKKAPDINKMLKEMGSPAAKPAAPATPAAEKSLYRQLLDKIGVK